MRGERWRAGAEGGWSVGDLTRGALKRPLRITGRQTGEGSWEGRGAGPTLGFKEFQVKTGEQDLLPKFTSTSTILKGQVQTIRAAS